MPNQALLKKDFINIATSYTQNNTKKRILTYNLNTQNFNLKREDRLVFQNYLASLYIMQLISKYEKSFNIPSGLLQAIALTESGTNHQGQSVLLPWPWCVNFEQKTYYFKTKQEAMVFVNNTLRFSRVIDVGPMQINLHYHQEAFANLDQAFDLENNVAYAAHLLTKLKEKFKTWAEAAKKYHSYRKTQGEIYLKKVLKNFKNRVQQALILSFNNLPPNFNLNSLEINRINLNASKVLHNYNLNMDKNYVNNNKDFKNNLDHNRPMPLQNFWISSHTPNKDKTTQDKGFIVYKPGVTMVHNKNYNSLAYKNNFIVYKPGVKLY